MLNKNFNVVKNNFDELPNNIEAEQSLIGTILLTNEIFDEINTIVHSNNFYDPMHQKIFSAIENLVYKGMLANPITLKNHFENEKDEINIPDYLVKITKFSTSSRQAIEYSKIIYDMFVRRELIKISEGTIDAVKLKDLNISGQNIIENSEKLLFDLAEKGSFNSSLVKFDEALKLTIEMASSAYKNEEGIVGVPTGLTDLDDRLGGLHKSDLVIIAGRPSMGKTALATNIAFNAAQKLQERGKKSSIAFFSLEMSSEQLSTRILAEQSRIKSNDIRRGRISDEQFDKFIETSKNISELPLFIDETPSISIAAVSNRARRIKRLFGLDMVVVDYIQLMRGTTFNKDFAYAVHTKIGDNLTSCEINGRGSPLQSVLKNGDLVNIIGTKNSSPSLQWVSHARTGKARAAIRRYWLNKKSNNPQSEKKYISSICIKIPNIPGKLGEVSSLIGFHQNNIINMEIMEKKTDYLEFIFDIQTNDLKNYKNLISELKLKEYKFSIIRHRKKDALLRRIFKNFKRD